MSADRIKFPAQAVGSKTEKYIIHVWQPGRPIEFSDFYPVECRSPEEARHRAEFILDELNRWKSNWQYTLYREFTDCRSMK